MTEARPSQAYPMLGIAPPASLTGERRRAPVEAAQQTTENLRWLTVSASRTCPIAGRRRALPARPSRITSKRAFSSTSRAAMLWNTASSTLRRSADAGALQRFDDDLARRLVGRTGEEVVEALGDFDGSFRIDLTDGKAKGFQPKLGVLVEHINSSQAYWAVAPLKENS